MLVLFFSRVFHSPKQLYTSHPSQISQDIDDISALTQWVLSRDGETLYFFQIVSSGVNYANRSACLQLLEAGPSLLNMIIRDYNS